MAQGQGRFSMGWRGNRVSSLYDPTRGANQPWSNFLPPEQAAREQTMASSRARPGPNRASAMGDPYGLSRGTGLPPAGEGLGGAALKGGATYAINPVQPGMSFTGRAADSQFVPGGVATEVPEKWAGWEQPGQANLGQSQGYVRLSGYPTRAEQMAPTPQTWKPGGPHGTQAVAALRAQRGPWEGRRDIEQVATGQAGSALMRAQAMAGVEQAGPQEAAETARLEAEARGAGAMGTILEGQALPAQRMLELWKTPEGQAQVMQEWQSASQAQKAQMAGEMLATYGEFLDPEVRQALQEAATGMRIETYDGEWWTGGGLLGGIADLFMGFFRGRPERRRAVPAPRAAVMGGPAAQVGASAGAAAIPGNVDTATASVEELAAIRDAAEAELQRRQQAGGL